MLELYSCLSPNSVKHAIFRRDRNFTEAFGDLSLSMPSNAGLKDWLWNTAALLIRPDAIAGGMADAIFPVLRCHGFIPVAAVALDVSENSTAELWRYQANVSTVERLNLLRRIMGAGQSIYVLLHDRAPRTMAPATVHLNHLKGTAIIKNRRKDQLRTIAGPALVDVMSFLHVADDPSDVVREMAILFSRPERLALIQRSISLVDCTTEIRSLLRYCYRRTGIGLLQRAAHIQNECSIAVAQARSDDMADPLLAMWSSILHDSAGIKLFIDGDSYDGRLATIPDAKEFSLPLDSTLLHRGDS